MPVRRDREYGWQVTDRPTDGPAVLLVGVDGSET